MHCNTVAVICIEQLSEVNNSPYVTFSGLHQLQSKCTVVVQSLYKRNMSYILNILNLKSEYMNAYHFPNIISKLRCVKIFFTQILCKYVTNCIPSFTIFAKHALSNPVHKFYVYKWGINDLNSTSCYKFATHTINYSLVISNLFCVYFRINTQKYILDQLYISFLFRFVFIWWDRSFQFKSYFENKFDVKFIHWIIVCNTFYLFHQCHSQFMVEYAFYRSILLTIVEITVNHYYVYICW